MVLFTVKSSLWTSTKCNSKIFGQHDESLGFITGYHGQFDCAEHFASSQILGQEVGCITHIFKMFLLAPGPMNAITLVLPRFFPVSQALAYHHTFTEEMLLFNLPVLSPLWSHALSTFCSLKSLSLWSSSEPHVSFFHLVLSFLATLPFVASPHFPTGLQNVLLLLGMFFHHHP